MALSTYAELKASIADWLNRDDLTTQVADFIALAEAQMERDIRHWRMDKRATATFDSRFTAVPADYLELIRLQVSNEKHPLSLVNAFQMHEMRNRAGDETGTPRYMALVDGSFEVFPTPDEDYTGTLFYKRTLPRLSDSNTSNWLLAAAPDIYLYCSLMQSAPFLRDDERLAAWGELYTSGVTQLNKQSERATHGGTIRMRIGAS